MPYKSLVQFISALEKEGELVRVKEFVSPNLEITEIADRFSKNDGKALLFENTGTEFPLLINAMGSAKRICMALGVDTLDSVSREIGEMVKLFMSGKTGLMGKLRMLPALKEISSWIPKVKKGRGACQEVVMDEPDLTRLPVLTCWPFDGGPFITLPAVHTRDPETGSRNLGMYRMQVFGPALTGMHWHMHKGSAAHYRKYKERGERMPVSVTLGGDPAYTYAATAPLPENLDEYLLAGFLRKKKVELVKCLTNDLEVPADADFVIEGYVDPSEELILEGPFGDHTGFYSLADYYPRFHVTCITHRREAVYPATIVGIPPQEDGWIGLATEKIFLEPIRMTVAPEILDMHMPVEGVFHNITLIKIRKQYPGHPVKVMNALWGAGQMMFNKVLVVLDDEAGLQDYRAVLDAVLRNTDPLQDIHFSRGPVDILDHSSSLFAYGSKMGIDATSKEATVGVPVTAGTLKIVPLDKSASQAARPLASAMHRSGDLAGTKFLLLVDPAVKAMPLPDIAWIAANNIDPLRDCFYIPSDTGNLPVLCIDSTRKRPDADGFRRQWPNITVMDDLTIRSIDDRWESLGLGTLIHSPSLRYKSLVENEGAVVL